MGDPNREGEVREAEPSPASATTRVLASLSAASDTFSRDAAAAVGKFEKDVADQAASLDARAAELEERAAKLRRSELALKVARQSFASHQRSLASKRREEQKYGARQQDGAKCCLLYCFVAHVSSLISVNMFGTVHALQVRFSIAK